MNIFKKFNTPELILAIFTFLAISLFYFFFNFNYLSKWIDEKGDAITYNYYVKLGIPQYLFNPHHIGFDWLGERMLHFARKNGFVGKSMIILQLRNLIISSIGLGLFFFFFYKISKRYFLSLIFVFLMGFSCAFWIYSQINDTPIIHSVLISILFLSILYFPQVKHKFVYIICIATLHAITIFFHQSDVIFSIIILFVITFSYKFTNYSIKNYKELDVIEIKPLSYSQNQESKLLKYNLQYSIVYILIFSIIVVSAYYYVGIIRLKLTLDPNKASTFNNIKGSSYFFNWLVLYAKIDYWGKGYDDANLFEKVSHGISTYFYQPQDFNGNSVKTNFKAFFSPNAILPNLIGVYFFSIIISLILFFKGLYKKYKFTLFAVLLFILVYFIFAFWWEPSYREFWVVPMFSVWFLSFFIFNFLIENANNFKLLVSSIIYSFLLLFVSLLFYFNFTGFIYPHAGNDYRKFNIVKKERVIQMKSNKKSPKN